MLFPSDHASRMRGKVVPTPALYLLFFVYPVIQTVQNPLTERDGYSAEYADVGLRNSSGSPPKTTRSPARSATTWR
ncbi:hypothetical protein [Streptomyces sp. P9-2]